MTIGPKIEKTNDHINKLSGLVKSVTKMVTGCCKSDKSCHIYSIRLKGLLIKYEEYDNLSIFY